MKKHITIDICDVCGNELVVPYHIPDIRGGDFSLSLTISKLGDPPELCRDCTEDLLVSALKLVREAPNAS